MTTTVETDWEAEDRNPMTRKIQELAFDIGSGILLGTTAGMAAFVDAWIEFLEVSSNSFVFLSFIVISGVLTFLITSGMRRSFRVCAAGYLTAMAVIIGGFVLPGYLIAELGQVKQFLVPNLAGDSLGVVFYILTPLYIGSYLLTLTVYASFE
jgi:hypothetical protein